MTRRDWLAMMTAIGAGSLSGCTREATAPDLSATRIAARPGTPRGHGAAGRATIAAATSQAVLYVPPSVQSSTPAPLLVHLHGAFREADQAVTSLQAAADAAGVIVLAPYAAVATWDAINDVFGVDIDVIDAALAWVFDHWTIRPDRLALSGFSDGGTYALAVGRANGDLFSRVVAYSPGVLLPVRAHGRPPVLITHGTADDVLPIDQCSRVIVPQLRALDYVVDYREFNGPHTILQSAAAEVMAGLGAP